MMEEKAKVNLADFEYKIYYKSDKKILEKTDNSFSKSL